MKSFAFIFSLLLSLPVFADYFELGVSGSYKQSYIDDNSWDTMTAYTGSAAWYFGPMSALELSYTYGSQQRYLHFTDRPDQTTTAFYELLGADVVITLASQDARIRPYVKGGGAYLMNKKVVYETAGTSVTLDQAAGFVPSVGAGIKIAITKDFALKLGADGWASTPVGGWAKRWDYVLRAGLSWMF